MGEPRKLRKRYSRPKVKHEGERIAAERKLVNKYGLKNKKEIWKAEAMVKRIRSVAKGLLTAPLEEQKDFLVSLGKRGLIQAKDVDDVLELKTENVLDRRLQTIVAGKFKLRPKQARQAIVHGNVLVGERKVNIPSFSVNLDSEMKISYIKVK